MRSPASNAPFVHYLDLWSMDSCIAYLIVRVLCVGLRVLLLASPWLVSVAKSDARQPLLAWLMKAAAKRMANKIIAA